MSLTVDQVKQLTVEATSYCNLHCPQCSRFDEQGHLAKNLTLGHIDLEIFKNAIKPNTFPNIQLIQFEGDYGDIMMHPDADTLIDYACSISKVVAITNGSMRSPKWWAKLGKIKNLTVQFSIDGLEDTNHIYRINSNYKRIIDNASAYIKSGGRAEWKFIIFKHNQHQVEQARKIAYDLGFVDFITQASSRNFFGGNTIWPVMLDGVFSHYLEMSDLTVSARDKTSIESIKLLADKNYKPPNCQHLSKYEVYLNHRGHLLPCCMVSSKTWNNDMTSKLWMRILKTCDNIDISKHTVEEILNGDFYRKDLKESLLNPKRVHHVCLSHCSPP
jgi:sulfatase maturation enzyme AslB (radical SAM superfamily)